jgi:hypothetical protein
MAESFKSVTAMRLVLLVVIFSVLAIKAGAQESPAANNKEATAPVLVKLTEEQQREVRTALDGIAARDHEYREAVLNAQAAQARLEATNSAMETRFYRLCALYKLDPDKCELTPDAKAIRPKAAPKPTPQSKN